MSEVQTETQKTFSTADTIFAWLCFVACYLYCRVFPATINPLGGALVLGGLFIVAFIVFAANGAKPSKKGVLSAISSLLLLLSLVVTSDEFLHFFAFGYSMLSFIYFIYSAWKNNIEEDLSDFVLADYFKALVIMPFASFGAPFVKNLMPGGSKGKKTAVSVIAGILLAIIPTALVLSLLSYDRDFLHIISTFLKLSWDGFFSQFFSVTFGFLMAMYVFGAYHSSKNKKCKEIITRDSCKKASGKIKFISPVTAIIAVVPVIAVYVIFFVSQWKYYVAGFTGVLPENFIYSEYAREGFFQLCTVAAINLVIIAVMLLFTKLRNEKTHPIVRILSVIISVCTFVLMSTAFSKLVMYIKHFGLTQLRVYSAWFMILLVFVFALVIVKQIKTDFKLIPVAFILCVVFYTVLSFSGVNGFIAKYNTDRYFDGSIPEVDLQTIYDLGDEAVPQLERIANDLDKKYGTNIAEFAAYSYSDKPTENIDKTLYEKMDRKDRKIYDSLALELWNSANYFEKEFKSMTIPHYKAGKTLERLGFTLDDERKTREG